MRREELRAARKYMDEAVAIIMAELNGDTVNCHTRIGPDKLCGHSATQHDGDESGMDGPEPCMVYECPCQNFTRNNLDAHAILAEEHGGIAGATRKSAEGALNIGMPGTTVQKWADEAMFTAEPINADEGPKVHLLWMTADPLAAIAAPSKMYKGEVARSLRDVTHAERQEYVEQLKATKLKAPYEFVRFHFLIEGVTRAFTHQMVRQRTAVYAQESLRFAVKEDMPVALPPSLAGTKGVWRDHERALLNRLNDNDDLMEYDAGDAKVERGLAEAMVRESDAERRRWQWDTTVAHIDASYNNLVAQGMPAEDARGLLPHNTLTRLHYSTDLRALLDHAGNRLCTQAQFEWRLVFAKIAEAIRKYNPYANVSRTMVNSGDDLPALVLDHYYETQERWQYEAIADLFRPVCYQTGKCEFKANFDRACSIRERVDANNAIGRSPSEWHLPVVGGKGEGRIEGIQPAEWLLDPGAAR